MSFEKIIIETVGLGMRFGHFDALKDVSVRIEKNTVHALLGENGAGKSTLVNCLTGSLNPTSGQYSFFGLERSFASPHESQRLGIGMVHQHFTLVDNMTVAENFLLAREPIPLYINWSKERNQLEMFMKKMPFQLDLGSRVSSLSAGEKQKLEILKQLYFNRKILILDEPTSVLNPGEADEVLGFLKKKTRESEFTVLMITHKFREVLAYADNVTILQKGQFKGTLKVQDTTQQEMAELMVGQAVLDTSENLPAETELSAKPFLEMKNLQCLKNDGRPQLTDLSLEVRRGEILGIAGVSGNGQKGIMDILSGLQLRYEGSISVDGKPFEPKRSFIREHGIGLLPELPLKNGSAPGLTVEQNLALRNYDQPPLSPNPLYVSKKEIVKQAEKRIKDFNIMTPGPDTPIRNLSGGNVQRTILARELETEPKLLVVADPCFGLDFAATRSIRSRIMDARNKGAAVLLISSDLDEIMELSDRIAVIFEGRITWTVKREDADRSEIGATMAGKEQTGDVA